MKDDDKIKKVDFDPDPVAGHVEALRRHKQAIIEAQAIIAVIRKESYDAHIKAGFTEAQALELCKQVIPKQ